VTDERGSGPAGDPGLQPERTTLAWQRTALAATTSALVLVRVAVTRDAPAVTALAAALAVVAVAVMLEGSVRHDPRRRSFDAADADGDDHAGGARGLPSAARGTVGVTVALAVAGLALVVAS
jgi:uncharacterized membrane protein YidH (DUF202 family)